MLDKHARMVGIVTVDDIVDVVEEETPGTFKTWAARQRWTARTLHAPFFELVRKRAGWLMILFVGEMFTATAMSFFERKLKPPWCLHCFCR